MRFKVKPQADHGDIRTRTRFAWLPVTIGDTNVWLESYFANERYVISAAKDLPPRWSVTSLELTVHDGMW